MYHILYRYLKLFMSYRVLKLWKSDTDAHTHKSGRQLKITFLDILEYSEYSETNILKKKKIHENIASLVRKRNDSKVIR